MTHLLGLYFAANTVEELVDQMQIFGEEVTPEDEGMTVTPSEARGL